MLGIIGPFLSTFAQKFRSCFGVSLISVCARGTIALAICIIVVCEFVRAVAETETPRWLAIIANHSIIVNSKRIG